MGPPHHMLDGRWEAQVPDLACEEALTMKSIGQPIVKYGVCAKVGV